MSIRSERIKALIEQSKQSYQELEKITGIKKSSLQRYASGVTTKIPLDVIEKLANTFNVSREYLLGWSENEKKERISNFSERITTALAIRNMRQIELSRRTGTPKSAMSQYISGAFEPRQDRIFLIARALNVSEAWLMGYDVPMERKENSSPEEPQLDEEEEEFLELFRLVPKEHRSLLLQMIRVALKTKG